MKFALLGDDPAAIGLVRAIATHPEHRLIRCALVGAQLAEVVRISPSVVVCERWDELLVNEDIDAVIVAGSALVALEGAKQLAAADKALIVLPRADQGAAWIYELSLIHDDTQTLLFPAFVHRVHPAVSKVRELINKGACGRILRLQMDRELPPHAAARDSNFLSRECVERAFLPDVDLLRFLGGEYDRITALDSIASDDAISLSTRVLSGDDLPDASWSVKATADPRWKVDITGETATAVLSADANGRLKLEVDGVDAGSDAWTTADCGSLLLAQFEDLADDEPAGERRIEDRAVARWSDLIRAIEFCDGAVRSLRRRRTIDLNFETTSERNLFKTQMTAIGCALLSLTLFAVVFVLMFGILFDPRKTVELRAERADSIVSQESFSENSPELTAAANARLNEIAERMSGSSFPVLVEKSPTGDSSPLDIERRETVVRTLKDANAPDADERTTLAPVEGRRFHLIMLVARVIVFAPLVVFLLMQALLIITRPSKPK